MPGKMSIFFMHDNGRSVRWRVRTSLIRIMIVLAIVLPVVVAASLYLNWHFFMERQSLIEEVTELQQEVDQHAQTSVRLANLEQFLARNDPETLNKLVVAMSPELPISIQQGADLADMEEGASSIVPNRRTGVTSEPAETTANTTPVADSSHTAPVDAAVSDSSGSSEPSGLSGSSGADTPAAGDTAKEDPQNAEGATPDTATVEPLNEGEEYPKGNVFIAGKVYPDVLQEELVDTGHARLENITARRVGARSMRISFDLFNNEKVQQLSGETGFELVLADGKVYPLMPQGDTQYRINRLKRITGNPTLPEEVTDITGAKIRISVYAKEGLVYRNLVTLQH